MACTSLVPKIVVTEIKITNTNMQNPSLLFHISNIVAKLRQLPPGRTGTFKGSKEVLEGCVKANASLFTKGTADIGVSGEDAVCIPMVLAAC
jgi:hypothetical protein